MSSAERLKAKIKACEDANPNNEQCATCSKFGKFHHPSGCESVNPLYWCEGHSKNIKEDRQ